MADDDSWFTELADKRVDSDEALRLRVLNRTLQQQRAKEERAAAREPEKKAPPRAEALIAAATFAAVADGTLPAYTPTPSLARLPPKRARPPVGRRDPSYPEEAIDGYDKRITGKQGLEAIIAEVQKSPDPFKAAGEWITKITQGITAVVAEADDEDED
jgi:hypothetical protein